MSRPLWLLLALLAAPVHAQRPLPAYPEGPRPQDLLHHLVAAHGRALLAEGAFDYDANAVLNEMPIGLWRGDFLERGLRERSRDALRVRNRMGYLIDARLTYCGPAQGRWRPVIAVAQHERFGIRFPAGLFELAFFGNAPYEGRRAILGPASFTRMRYQTIGFGAQHASRSHYARIDLVMGQGLDAADIRWADLYTGMDGRLLRANVNGDYLRSDTAGGAGNGLKGMGLALSGRWQLPAGRGAHGLLFELEAQDLGFCAWGRGTQRLRRDTTLRFEGIAIDDILDLDDALLGGEQLRDTLGIRFRESPTATWLPFRLSARMRGALGHGWKGAITVDQFNLPGYVPRFAVQGERALGPATEAMASLSLGGFGGLKLGAGLTHVFRDRWLAALATPHLPAFFTGRTRGGGLSITAACAF